METIVAHQDTLCELVLQTKLKLHFDIVDIFDRREVTKRRGNGFLFWIDDIGRRH